MAYSNKVVDKFEKTLKDPEAASVGRWKPGDADFDKVGTGIEDIKLNNAQKLIDGIKKIVDAKFKTYGCGSAIASSGQLIDMLKGKTIEEAKEICNQEIVDILELPPIKIHCSVLAEEAIKKAINDFESNNEIRKHNQ